jgi:hypothetical protein
MIDWLRERLVGSHPPVEQRQVSMSRLILRNLLESEQRTHRELRTAYQLVMQAESNSQTQARLRHYKRLLREEAGICQRIHDHLTGMGW